MICPFKLSEFSLGHCQAQEQLRISRSGGQSNAPAVSLWAPHWGVIRDEPTPTTRVRSCLSQTQRVALAQHTRKKGLTGAFCGSSNQGHQEPLHPFPTPSLHPWPATPHQLHFKLGGRSGPVPREAPSFCRRTVSPAHSKPVILLPDHSGQPGPTAPSAPTVLPTPRRAPGSAARSVCPAIQGFTTSSPPFPCSNPRAPRPLHHPTQGVGTEEGLQRTCQLTLGTRPSATFSTLPFKTKQKRQTGNARLLKITLLLSNRTTVSKR